MSALTELTDDEINRLAQKFFEHHWAYQEMNPTGTARRVAVYEFMRWLREDEEFEQLVERAEHRS